MPRGRKPRPSRKAYDPVVKSLAVDEYNDTPGSGVCCGPFSEGSGGNDTCTSCCNVCPPSPCCTCFDFYFDCGCDCDPPAMAAMAVKKPDEIESNAPNFKAAIAEVKEEIKAFKVTQHPNYQKMPVFPKFNYESIKSPDGRFKFALEVGGCSIPCAEVLVTVCTDGCCISDGLAVVGDGTLTATVDEGTLDEDCGSLTVLINGSPSPYAAVDGEGVSVTLTSDDPTDCPCTETRVENPCGTPFWLLEEGTLRVANLNSKIAKLKSRRRKLNR